VRLAPGEVIAPKTAAARGPASVTLVYAVQIRFSIGLRIDGAIPNPMQALLRPGFTQ
jgi:hypothetical protein